MFGNYMSGLRERVGFLPVCSGNHRLKINSDVPACYPRVTCTFRYGPLLDQRAVCGVEHDVHVSVPRHSIAHGCQREIGRVRLLERLDLGLVIDEARGAVPCVQDERAAVRNGEKDQVGQGCIVRALRQCVGCK